MPTETPAEQQLTKLNLDIEHLEEDVSRLGAERGALAKEAGRAGRRLGYLRFVRTFRSPTTGSFEMWPTAALVLGPVVSGVLLLILISLVTGSFVLGFVAFLAGAAAGAAMVWSLLNRPPDSLLPSELAEADSERRVAQVRLEETTERLTAAKEQLKLRIEERRALVASGKVQRAALLQREWKTMPEPEWEDFIVEVCRTLGATVERIRRTTEGGANLLVEFGSRRVAVLTTGEGRNVNSSAVQQAIASRERHHCASCAVIINRRFTGAAQDYAARNGCTLIGIEEFPDFVLGKIEL